MSALLDKVFVWGYVLDKVPSFAPFVFEKTRCSLETEAAFLGAKRAFYNNSMFSKEYYEKYFHYMDKEIYPNCLEHRLSPRHFGYLKNIEELFCTLEHGNYPDSAVRIATLSLTHKNIKGIHIDDFSPEAGRQLPGIHDAVKAINPDLKIAAVTYSHQPADVYAKPFAKYIDLFSRWCWVPSLYYWDHQAEDIQVLREAVGPGKAIVQGIYIHDFGSNMRNPHAVPLEIFKKSVAACCENTLNGTLDGLIIPQAAWFSAPSKYEHIAFLKNYLAWADSTAAVR